MKTIRFVLSLAVLLCTRQWLHAQTNPPRQINFQGKLYQNNVPFTGTGNFQFIISNPAWIQTSNNVQVQDGLYTVVLGSGNNPMPGDMFANQESVEMMVSFNGTQIDIVTLYAPFEKDYTVPENIKDGIDWTELSNVPTLDMSSTNEIQTLNINGNTLSLSQGGGSVTLPQGSSEVQGDLFVNGAVTVIDTSCFEMFNDPAFDNQSAQAGAVWQTFRATSNGQLRKVRLSFSVTGGSAVTVKLFAGTDLTAMPLASAFNVPVGNSAGQMMDRLLNVTNLINPSASLEAGQIYTVQVSPPAGGQFTIRYRDNNPYPYGRCHISPDTDLSFGIYLDHSSPASLSVNANGNVGIGVNNPAAALQVGGRIMDQTGFVTPVGAILPFAGSNVPLGWMLCNGAAIDRLQYADLFQAIGTGWGVGDGTNTFNLPDLQGIFLRGVDGNANLDPDKAGRIGINGGNSGNNVGSFQGDEIRSHNHNVYIWSNWGAGGTARPNGSDGGGVPWNFTYTSNNTGGNETRPKNSYVNYIIKY
jgi:microcystin-dependent protein